MRTMSDAQAHGWCAERDVHVELGPPGGLRLGDGGESRFRVSVPDEATAVVALAYVIVMTGVESYEEENFKGAMVWMRRWEIWSESIDRVGYSFMGADAPTDQTPARLFAAGEFVGAQAALSLPMMFQWDALFVPAMAGFSVEISHHGHFDFIVRAQEQAALLNRFRDWDPLGL